MAIPNRAPNATETLTAYLNDAKLPFKGKHVVVDYAPNVAGVADGAPRVGGTLIGAGSDFLVLGPIDGGPNFSDVIPFAHIQYIRSDR
jgi:hypothetical protein